MSDHTALKEAAERATPGPWYRKDAESNGTYGIEYIDAVEGNPQSEGGFSDIANCSEVRFWRDRIPQNVEPDQRKANAHFIALANPSTILELLAENEALREALEPFARFAFICDTGEPHPTLGENEHVPITCSIGDLRRARALTEVKDG